MRLTTIPAFALFGRTLALIVLLIVTAPPGAAEEEYFRPKPPMPEKFDWIQMTSEEWLKGELISMYDDSLEFDSKEFDLQTVDWGDVKEVRSKGTMQVAFEDGTIAIGRLFIDQQTVRVISDGEMSFPRAGLLSITAGAPKEINYWSIKASLGANIREGNSKQLETTSKASLIRRTPKNRINIDWLATFNRTDGETAADNQRASVGWNRYLSKRFYITPIYGEWYRDPFINIGSRWTIGVGAGYELIKTSKTTWDVNAGLAYQTTSFVSVEDGEDDSVDTPALRIGTAFDHELTKWMDFLFAYDLMIVNEDSGTYTHHLETGLELELTSLLDFDITFIWDRTRNPQSDQNGLVPKQDDYRLVFFLGFDF